MFQVPLISESMTAFRHLKQLELDICISREYDLLNIVHILNASPALQKLHLTVSILCVDLISATLLKLVMFLP